MLKNHKLAKAIQEIGFYQFKSILIDKAFNNGKQVVLVDRFYPSSKTCHICGYVNPKVVLGVEQWKCPVCSSEHDRDINAALNILHKWNMTSQSIVGEGTAEITNACGEPRSSAKQEISQPSIAFQQ